MKVLKLIFVLLAVFLLLNTPYVGMVLRAFNTMIHESGHAIMTLITSGKVDSISLFVNTEGVTKTYSSSWISSILVSLSGYIFSSIVLVTLAHLWKRNKHKMILVTLGILSMVNVLLWVRNMYGIAWLIVFTCFVFATLKIKNRNILMYITLSLFTILLADAFRASFDILYLSYIDSTNAGDATNLQKHTLMPAIVWGIVFFLQNLMFS